MLRSDSESVQAPAGYALNLEKQTSLSTNPDKLPDAVGDAFAAGLNDFMSQMPDLVCFSHLRWDFVYQRPQHLLSRFSRHGRVFFVEEPVFHEGIEPRLDVSDREGQLKVLLAYLPQGLVPEEADARHRELITRYFHENNLDTCVFWYYSPMFLEISRHLKPVLTVYDCMDELSAFKGAPPRLRELEAELFQKADLVFTGGHSLYEFKRNMHPQVHAFPSSIDRAHFGKARGEVTQPEDQANIPHPRIGFFGVIDERLDIDLVQQVASARPDWHFVLIGPVVKIDPASLPQNPNIHYLGGKSYQDLPAYLGSWDAAMLPFALNESTRFISPTKTPEYLAAGKPVVSTAIQDVVRPYGEKGLVHIAEGAAAFVAAIEKALAQKDDPQWLAETDAYLATISWDLTWQDMVRLMYRKLMTKAGYKAST
jgi:glycosyltransferase involved in cell wall biosynthesis